MSRRVAGVDVCVVDHPLAAARLSTLRDERSDRATFRSALHELTWMLVYEATRDAPREQLTVRTPLAQTGGRDWPARHCWYRCCAPDWACLTPRTP